MAVGKLIRAWINPWSLKKWEDPAPLRSRLVTDHRTPPLRAVTVVGLICIATVGCHRGDVSDATQRVVLAGRTFNLELALDPPSRHRGLSDRDHLLDDGGMLFVFPNPRLLDFVMRRCLIPLDLIYLGPGGRVVAIHRMQIEPYDTPDNKLRRYSSNWPAQFAIELPGGTIDTLKLDLGMQIQLPFKTLKHKAR